MTLGNSNRRRHERLAVPPMYTPVAVRLMNEQKFTREGHSYDVSEGGVQFELDEAIAPGTTVAVRIELPNSFGADPEAAREVYAVGNVVWVDDSEPGPVRLAVVFTRFASEQDREALLTRIRSAVRTRNAA
ncbi:hypothetical protein PHYC_02761 [Phycisphaerales bacterium]|nr:hypothetical protein PHYC_02761 [Phycisphaerales bacterium]